MGTIYQFTLDTIYSAYENIKNTICCWWCKLVYSSQKYYPDRMWGMEIKTANRLDPKDGIGLRFAVAVTIKEVKGINRIDEFIKNFQLESWLVNRIDVKARIDINETINETIEFE